MKRYIHDDIRAEWGIHEIAAWAGKSIPIMQPDNPLSGLVLRLQQVSRQ